MHGHRERRAHRLSGHLAGGRVHSGRDVHRDDRRAGAVHALDERRRLRPRLAVEAGAEERVDDEIRAVLELLDGVLAGLPQDARRDPPVAAVRAATADAGDLPRIRVPLEDRLRNPAAGALHHRLDIVPGLGRAHLLGGVERLKHR